MWRAITESEFTLLYYYGSSVESDWKAGATFRYAIDGNEAIVGTDPRGRSAPSPGPDVRRTLGRGCRPDAPSRLTWEIEEVSPGVVKVTTIHDEFPSRTATFEQVSGGMPFILSGLKSVLETGEPLVPAGAAAATA